MPDTLNQMLMFRELHFKILAKTAETNLVLLIRRMINQVQYRRPQKQRHLAMEIARRPRCFAH